MMDMHSPEAQPSRRKACSGGNTPTSHSARKGERGVTRTDSNCRNGHTFSRRRPNAEGFTKLLWSGGDAVTEIPTGRWSLDQYYAEDPDAAGKMTTRHGAFLKQVDQFDAEFFGISRVKPR